MNEISISILPKSVCFLVYVKCVLCIIISNCFCVLIVMIFLYILCISLISYGFFFLFYFCFHVFSQPIIASNFFDYMCFVGFSIIEIMFYLFFCYLFIKIVKFWKLNAIMWRESKRIKHGRTLRV